MPDRGVVREWITRPDFAASDWPAGELREKRRPLPIALRVMNSRNIVGLLTLITPSALAIDGDGPTQLVPFGIVRGYAIVEGLIEYSANLLA